MLGDIPGGNGGSDGRRHVQNRSQGVPVLHREGYDARAMAMNDGHDLGTCLEQRAMNEALGIRFAADAADGLTVVRKLHDVVGFDALWGTCAREQKVFRPLRMPNRDVTEGVEHLICRENTVGCNEVVLQLSQIHRSMLPAPPSVRSGPQSRHIIDYSWE